MRARPSLTFASVALICGFMGAQAQASLTVDTDIGGPTGTSYSNFNNLSLGNAGGTSGGLSVTFSGDAAAVQGAASGLYAAPYLSNNNGLLFGDSNNGSDTTHYLSTGIGSVTMLLGSSMQYFGLLWGSVDNYNVLSFYDGAVLVGSLTGSDVWADANGDQGVQGSFYVNINSTLAFDRVVASSGGYAFEFDNVAYLAADPVPEPATLAMFGLGIVLMGFLRQRLRSIV